MQSIVSSCEKALKMVSDQLTDVDSPKPMETDKKDIKKELKKPISKVVIKEEKKPEPAKDQYVN